jgi:hypothetical protein
MGLISNGMQQPAAPAGPMQEQPGPQNPALQRIVLAATKLIHNPQTTQALVELIRKSPDPVQGIAHAVVMILTQMFQASKGTMPKDAGAAALKPIIELIVEVADAAGIVKGSPQLVQQVGALLAQRAKGIMQKAQQQQPGQQPGAQPQPGQQPQPAAPQPTGI